jgi:hypothetical protein
MSFGVPWGLAALAALGALVWLWRFVGARHRMPVSSLAPFQHLLRRSPVRRARRVANVLFWLQAAALAAAALALADPRLPAASVHTTLVVLDTSASMAARAGGTTAMEAAKRRLLQRVGPVSAGERVVVMTSAPIDRLSLEPLTDRLPLQDAVGRAAPADLAGNLSLAWRIGQMLLDAPADRTLIVSDEAAPTTLGVGVEFERVGEPADNVAIVGVDAHEPLCLPTDAPAPAASATDAAAAAMRVTEGKLIVWVQNFARQPQEVTVRLRGLDAPREERVTLQPQAREAVAFQLPASSAQELEVAIEAPHDALDADNRVVLPAPGAAAIRVVVDSERPAFVDTIGAWLDACPRIAWSRAADASSDDHAAVLITDRSDHAQAWPSAAMVFAAGDDARMLPARWVIESAHPIAEYLQPLQSVPTAAAWTGGVAAWGDPVLSGISQGRKLPLLTVAAGGGRRMVGVWFDPTARAAPVPEVLVFLNSLRWLTGAAGLATTGQTLTVGPFAPGRVEVRRPSGQERALAHEGGLLRYDRTDAAGWYAFRQGDRAVRRAVNFLDPVESNLSQPRSTWADPGQAVPTRSGARPHRSLAGQLLLAVLALMILEWIVYIWRTRRRGA